MRKKCYISSIIKNQTNMKKLVLIRIGQVPNPQVTEALVPHMTGRPVAFPIPGAIVSIFDTPHSIEQVSKSVKEVGVFFFLVEFDKMQFELPEPVMELISQVIGEKPQEEIREWSIDEILDLINQNGIDSLTPEQRQILDQGRL